MECFSNLRCMSSPSSGHTERIAFFGDCLLSFLIVSELHTRTKTKAIVESDLHLLKMRYSMNITIYYFMKFATDWTPFISNLDTLSVHSVGSIFEALMWKAYNVNERIARMAGNLSLHFSHHTPFFPSV
jgi:hypothetical protein